MLQRRLQREEGFGLFTIVLVGFWDTNSTISCYKGKVINVAENEKCNSVPFHCCF